MLKNLKNNMMVVVTKEILAQGMSLRGGWSMEQLRLLGVPTPLRSGWRKHLEGSMVSEENIAAFLALKDKHFSEKTLNKLGNALLNGDDRHKAGLKRLEKAAKPPRPKPSPPDDRIAERAQLMVDTFSNGNGSGSVTTTCKKDKCLHPTCWCAGT